MAARGPGRKLLLLLLLPCLLIAGRLAAAESRRHRASTGRSHATGNSSSPQLANSSSSAQVGNSSDSPRTASDRTVRVDPLDNFKKYRGGFDITKKHYWSSVIFTGIHGYSIAVLWLLGGAVYGVYRAVASCCFAHWGGAEDAKKPPFAERRARFWPVAMAILLTMLVIVASIVVLVGSSRFHTRIRSVRNIIGNVADGASATIHNITGAVSAMQFNPVAFAQIEKITHLNATSRRLTEEAAKIQDKANKSVRLISKGLKILQTTTIVTVSVNLVAILALLGSRLLRLRRSHRVLLIVTWLMTSLFWMLFGLYFFLGGFSGDTCIALEDYRQDPRNSSLSSILPCSNQSSGSSALKATRVGIHNLITRVNWNISAMHRRTPQLPSRLICNPFSPPPEYAYQPENCSEGTTKIGDIPQVLKGFTCSGPEEGSRCQPGQFLSARDFETVSVYTGSIQSLLDSFPGVERLVNCQLVKDAFSEVLFKECRPLRKYAKMAWASMAALSTIMSLLALTAVAMGCSGDPSHAADGSVIPRDHSPGSTPLWREMDEKDEVPRLEHQT